MNYSPVDSELSSSFHKIGSEIDEIFSSLDIFSQTSDSFLKGGSSVDFLGPSKEPSLGHFKEGINTHSSKLIKQESNTSSTNSLTKDVEREAKDEGGMSDASLYRPDLTLTDHCSSNPSTFRRNPSDEQEGLDEELEVNGEDENDCVPNFHLTKSDEPTAPSSKRSLQSYSYNDGHPTPNNDRTSSRTSLVAEPSKHSVESHGIFSPTKPSLLDLNKTYSSRSSTPPRVDKAIIYSHSNTSNNLTHLSTYKTSDYPTVGLVPEKRMRVNSSNQVLGRTAPVPILNTSYHLSPPHSSTPNIKRVGSPIFATLPSKVIVAKKPVRSPQTDHQQNHEESISGNQRRNVHNINKPDNQHDDPYSQHGIYQGGHQGNHPVTLTQPDPPIEVEREMWVKRQKEMSECRKVIMDLTGRIQDAIENRNMLLYKVEASARLFSTQGNSNEHLSEKVSQLNQTLFDSDVDVNQLHLHVNQLNVQIEAAQEAQCRLFDRFEATKQQMETFKLEKDTILKEVKQANDEVTNILQKYQLLQRIHEHCTSLKENDRSERELLLDKLEGLNKAVCCVNKEKKDLVENLKKVYKLVEKLERKATEKIQMLSRELKDLQDRNSFLSGSVQEKDAMLSVSKATVRDLESKLTECEQQISEVKKSVEDHELNHKEIISSKNKKIKMLSLKAKQFQTRFQSLSSEISVLTETNEKLSEELRKEKTANKILNSESQARDSRIAELEANVKELEGVIASESARKAEDSANAHVQLEASIADLVQQKVSIQGALEKLEESNHLRLREIEELREELDLRASEYEKELGEVTIKLSMKEDKVIRLKEALAQLLEAKQESEGKLQENAFAMETLKLQLESAQDDADNRQRDLLEDFKEASIQLEEYKALVDSLQYNDPRLQEAAYKEEEVQLLRIENRKLNAALQKQRDKLAKMREDFGKKIKEQNDIIDNCVDKIAVESQIAELQAHYESRISELELFSG